jgi:hypothetical protein
MNGVKASEQFVGQSKLTSFLRTTKYLDPVTDMRKEVNHVYYEPSGFEYKIVLTRINFGKRMTTEKFTLYVIFSM